MSNDTTQYDTSMDDCETDLTDAGYDASRTVMADTLGDLHVSLEFMDDDEIEAAFIKVKEIAARHDLFADWTGDGNTMVVRHVPLDQLGE